MRKSLLLASFFLIATQVIFSQEWKNLKSYKKDTGKGILENGNWLKKDREKNSEIWQSANFFNLSDENGKQKYRSISQIRDFYLWFDEERKKLGHEVISFGVAAVVAEQLSNFDNSFIRTIIVHNKQVIWFGNEGSKRVFAYYFPLMKELYFSDQILKAEEAKAWDLKIGKIEQCEIVEPIYDQLSSKALKKLERMAKGKLIYNLKVNKKLKYEGDIRDCQSRSNHAFTKVSNYYLEQE